MTSSIREMYAVPKEMYLHILNNSSKNQKQNLGEINVDQVNVSCGPLFAGLKTNGLSEPSSTVESSSQYDKDIYEKDRNFAIQNRVGNGDAKLPIYAKTSQYAASKPAELDTSKLAEMPINPTESTLLTNLQDATHNNSRKRTAEVGIKPPVKKKNSSPRHAWAVTPVMGAPPKTTPQKHLTNSEPNNDIKKPQMHIPVSQSGDIVSKRAENSTISKPTDASGGPIPNSSSLENDPPTNQSDGIMSKNAETLATFPLAEASEDPISSKSGLENNNLSMPPPSAEILNNQPNPVPIIELTTPPKSAPPHIDSAKNSKASSFFESILSSPSAANVNQAQAREFAGINPKLGMNSAIESVENVIYGQQMGELLKSGNEQEIEEVQKSAKKVGKSPSVKAMVGKYVPKTFYGTKPSTTASSSRTSIEGRLVAQGRDPKTRREKEEVAKTKRDDIRKTGVKITTPEKKSRKK